MVAKNFKTIRSFCIYVGFVGCMGLSVLDGVTQYKLKWTSSVGWLAWSLLCFGLILEAVHYKKEHT